MNKLKMEEMVGTYSGDNVGELESEERIKQKE
jgi:hypothetical protein